MTGIDWGSFLDATGGTVGWVVFGWIAMLAGLVLVAVGRRIDAPPERVELARLAEPAAIEYGPAERLT